MMSGKFFFTSVARISNLREIDFAVENLPRPEWATGDYVVAEVVETSTARSIELDSGRMIEVAEGDLIVGALGRRHATLEATGNWEAIGDDLRLEALTAGGLLGRQTSRSALLSPLIRLVLRGHVVSQGKKVRMRDYVEPSGDRQFTTPVVLVIGTSMSAGKTTAARIIVRGLKRMGRTVIGAKLTGAARYRDILSMKDAGADHIFDFVDMGFPSSVCPADDYSAALRQLLSRMAETEVDVAVIELGASPLEPYNGDTAVEAIVAYVRSTVLCASDPYSVVGVMNAYEVEPDLVTGPASNTEAGRELVKRLTGLDALDILDKSSLPELWSLLKDRLSLD